MVRYILSILQYNVIYQLMVVGALLEAGQTAQLNVDGGPTPGIDTATTLLPLAVVQTV